MSYAGLFLIATAIVFHAALLMLSPGLVAGSNEGAIVAFVGGMLLVISCVMLLNGLGYRRDEASRERALSSIPRLVAGLAPTSRTSPQQTPA